MKPTEQISKGTLLAGRYRVSRRLGAGGMATVFLATDERLGREVAVKRLHTDAPEASLTRFKREARLGAALNHPNLVTVYDTVVTDEGALIVMEYVPGTSLADLAAHGPVRPDSALPILRSIAEALDHAHAQDVVHRDVKPANVLLGDDGVVKLADLGIARAVGATQLTSEGSVVGTLPYMSPERMRGPGAGGPESDVYALAAVALELLSGDPPSETASDEARNAGRAPNLRASWLDAPGRSPEVLARGLDPDPGRRPPTATLLVSELNAALTVEAPVRPLTAPTAPLDPPTDPTLRHTGTGPDSSRSGGRRLAVAGIAAAVLLMVGIAVASLVGGGDDEGRKGSASAATDPPAKSESLPAETQAEPDPEPAPAPAPEPEPAPAADGVALNDQGFALIGSGDYDAAVPVLEQAVAALEGSGDELTYGYALFNLGSALRLAGRPEEAIPILEQRLEYGDQRAAVERELEAAYADAGVDAGASGGVSGASGGPGNGNGNAFGRSKQQDDD